MLALDEEALNSPTLPQNPGIFLHIPAAHLSPPTPPPAPRDPEEGRRVAQPSSTLARPTGGQNAGPDTSTRPRQSIPLGTGGQGRLPVRDLVPSGDDIAGVSRGRGTGSYAAIESGGSRVGGGARSHEPTADPSLFRPPPHMVKTSKGWVGTGLRNSWGVHPPLPTGSASQANVQVGGSSGAVVGGGVTVGGTSPGKERRLVSLGGKGGGGGGGQGNENPPIPSDTPGCLARVEYGNVPEKLTPWGAVGGVGYSGGSGCGGDGGGGGAAIIEQGGVERRLSRSTSSMDDSFYVNLADKRHTWAFGAIAELVHNSSDAEATEVRVSLECLGPKDDTTFVVIDNGHGMTHPEMEQLFTIGKDYGHGSTAPAGERIGCNGVGFKQGVLRLGDTAVVVSVRGERAYIFE